MRVLICGDRNWTNYNRILEVLQQVRSGIQISMVIEGEARGADRMGLAAARKLNLPVMRFPADWKKYGKAAGPIRNQQMLTKGNPSIVLAFHNDLDHSKGTKDMVDRALKHKIPVILFTETEQGELS